ncbi:hypothetical protein K443DRAFT_12250 [Laccaria amethystina LaAM-08-1]|uniref:DUF5648 domain-containing protein n=1 Tax=Laccaria amethystina LaAM-08-1 TaxID=1095629 RepID=A0A0C9WRV2_9AGAR|nr:hypothetical protein K443DRAFT_12250 [Laccaria amethystina LaAM-08-1]
MRFTFGLVTAIVSFAAGAAAGPLNPLLAPKICGDPRLGVPLLRAYNPIELDHFYTTNIGEFQNAITKLGYIDEGTTGYIFPSQEPHTIAFYRMFNSAIKDYFHTTSVTERDNALHSFGYTYQGIAGYLYPDTAYGTLPLYRLNNPSATDHFYTMSADERDTVSVSGYFSEGIVGYLFPF